MFQRIRRRVSALKDEVRSAGRSAVSADVVLRATHESRIGVWDWHIPSGKIQLNECWAKIVGSTLSELKPTTFQTCQAFVHPDDIATSNALLNEHFQGHTQIYSCETRMRHKNGYWIWVLDQGQVVEWNRDGAPVRMIGTHTDITAGKFQQEALEQVLAARQRVFNAVPHMLAYLDTSYVFQFYNEHFIAFFGLDPQTFSGDFFTETLCSEFLQSLRSAVDQALTGVVEPLECELTIYRSPLAQSVLKVLITPDQLEQGLVEGVFLSLEDITDFKEAQVQKEALAQRLDFALQASQTGVWDFDVHEGVLTWDEQMFLLYKVDKSTFTHSFESWARCVPEPDVERVTKIMNHAMENKEPFYAIFPVNWPGGEIRHFSGHARCILDEQGVVVRMVGTNQDVTESVRSKAKLESALHDQVRQHAMFQAMSTQGKIGAWELNLARQTLFWSREVCLIHEVDFDFVPTVENGLEFYLAGHHRDAVSQAFTKALETGEPFSIKSQIRTAKGKLVWVRATGAVRSNSAGPVAVYGSFQDIDAQVLTEEELVRAKEKAEAATHSKSMFLANMSHEIRTPMNGVLGMLTLLRNGELDTQQRRRLELASTSASSLLRVINDILDFSKIEAGKLVLEAQTFDLLELIESSFAGMAILMESKGLEPVINLSALKHFTVTADPGRIRQVLTNLVGNAIKFTQSGSVQLSVSSKLTTDDELAIAFHIKDTGIGMDESVRAKLFQSFSQADETTTREYGGTGLGLAISMQLCQQMGGGIQVESMPGQGSCFSAFLCAKAVKEDPRPMVRRRKALVWMEHLKASHAIMEQLHSMGVEVVIRDPQLMVERLLSSDSKGTDLSSDSHESQDLPDLIIVEVHDTYLSSIQMTLLRAKGVLVCGVVHGQTLESEQSLSYSELLHVPVFYSRLYEVCADLSPRDSSGKAMGGEKIVNPKGADAAKDELLAAIPDDYPAADVTKSRTRVLLVEDNEINQEYANALLEMLGFEVTLAVNGQEALSLLSAADKDSDVFSLCFMDCQMPVLDGYRATGFIRDGVGGEGHKKLTVIALTANAMDGDKERCIASGMDDYLPKPIDPDELEEKLRELEFITGDGDSSAQDVGYIDR